MTDEDSVVFSKLTYLGCASVNAPRSEVEALRMMSILRSQCQISLDVTLSVPNVSEGTVRYEACSGVLSDFMHLILFPFSKGNGCPVCLGGDMGILGFHLVEKWVLKRSDKSDALNLFAKDILCPKDQYEIL